MFTSNEDVDIILKFFMLILIFSMAFSQCSIQSHLRKINLTLSIISTKVEGNGK